MKEKILESLIFVIPLWSGIAFIAFKRHERFKKYLKHIFLTVLIITTICSVWNYSAYKFSHEIYITLQDKSIYEKLPFEKHMISDYYWYMLPISTLIFYFLLTFISKPEENSNNPSN
ncbi:hypothetical protein [Winogradskyella sediminis]|uniref:hypothetical protein n=1 Tax=Winogradskyella sediminis TaxID=1382466 RepID=UPI003AA95E63